MKRTISLFVSIFIVLSLFTGCAKSTDVQQGNSQGEQNAAANPEATNAAIDNTNNEEPKEVTVWFDKLFYDQSNEMLHDRVEEFAQQNNIKANIELIANQDMYTKWSAAIESGNYPDVSTFGSQEINQFAEKGLMRDLTDLMNRIEEKNGKLFENIKKSVNIDGKYYGIPRSANGHTLHYRKDLLEKAGFSEPPQTWEEYRDMAKAMTDPKNNIYGSGLGYGMKNSDAEWAIRNVLFSYGGALNDKDGKTVIVNSQETIDAFRLLADIFFESTPPSAANWDDTGNNKAFLSGQVAMVSNSASLYLNVKTDNPELFDKIAIAPLPAGPKGRVICGSVMTYGIFEGAKNPEIAEQIIEYIMDKDWYEKWSEGCAPLQAPTYQDLANESVWNDVPENNVIINTIMNSVQLGYPGPLNAKAGEIYNSRLLNACFQKIITKTESVEDAVKWLEDELNKAYAG